MPAESFEQLVTEGWSHPTEGWDFSWLGSRIQEDPLPWDYTATVVEMAKASPDLLDLGNNAASMPFANSSFHLIVNRHESFVPAELARVLVAGGHFVT